MWRTCRFVAERDIYFLSIPYRNRGKIALRECGAFLLTFLIQFYTQCQLPNISTINILQKIRYFAVTPVGFTSKRDVHPCSRHSHSWKIDGTRYTARVSLKIPPKEHLDPPPRSIHRRQPTLRRLSHHGSVGEPILRSWKLVNMSQCSKWDLGKLNALPLTRNNTWGLSSSVHKTIDIPATITPARVSTKRNEVARRWLANNSTLVYPANITVERRYSQTSKSQSPAD